ncbi:hypothetical protein TCDM_02695 [Trypanosoma cruzi Dm28c]|uniref:sn-1-specific diacylglycerol lipase n=2 Tax=Trypanosoma cruzi TaxID=5693 RepID=V5BQX7_TRYCR|nr:hypothetical protein TCDM_02695 [Trypanosoma cruzi Dm28c]PWU95987.1 hypothetical protein C4B63_20g182 [Trypanosoma cruzi]
MHLDGYMSGGNVWRLLFKSSSRRRRAFRWAWLWQSPVSRDHTPLWCICDGPVFVRSEGEVYQCEFCGGKQRGVECGPKSLFFGFKNGGCVSVTPGLGHGEGVRRVFGEIHSHVRATGTTYTDLVKRIPTAWKSSGRSLESYREWCDHVILEKENSCHGTTHTQSALIQRQHVSLDDVQLAVYALRLALAVYALPYELGYFNTPARSLWLWTPWYNRYTIASTADQVSSIRRILFGDKCDPLLEVAYARYSAALQQPCFSIFLDHRTRRVVVAFRGTVSLTDIITDVAGGYTNVCLGTYRSAVTGGTEELRTNVPRGFYMNVMEAGGHIMSALSVIREKYPDYTLLSVGHSLGAIEAILFHLLFFSPTTRQGADLRTIAFAPAPCVEQAVMTKVNELLGEEAMTSWVYGLDGVARLQTNSVRDLFFPSSSAGSSKTKKEGNEAQQPQLPQLSIPGRVLHLTEEGTVVLDVPANVPWREQLFFGKEALLHHLPSMYGVALHKALLAREASTRVSVEMRP